MESKHARTMGGESERERKEQSRDGGGECFSLIQDNGFNRWKSKITEG